MQKWSLQAGGNNIESTLKVYRDVSCDANVEQIVIVIIVVIIITLFCQNAPLT